MQEKHVFKSFLYFYEKIYKYSPPYTENSKKLCSTFLDILKQKYHSLDRLGVEFLWSYFIFQFEYWEKLEIKSYNKKINLSFIIGKKAIKRYLERDSDYDWQLSLNETYNKKDFTTKVGLEQFREKSTYDPDEIYRAELLNTDKGLSNCLIYTSLYKAVSRNCQTCKYIKDCIELQKQIYPQIYKNRKIEYGSAAR